MRLPKGGLFYLRSEVKKFFAIGEVMDYPFLRGMMRLCRMRQYELAQFLKNVGRKFQLTACRTA